MRVGLFQYAGLSDEGLQFAAQLGVSTICINNAHFGGADTITESDVAGWRKRCEAYGLALESIENVPVGWYLDAMLGTDKRDAAIEHYQRVIRAIGAAGVPTLGLHWMPSLVWRSRDLAMARAGAPTTQFDLATADAALTHGREYDADEMWTNFRYFMDAVLPVATEASVRFAIHPDDPPVPMLGGVARIFSSFDGFKRLTDTYDSPSLGLNFCVGTWSEMGPDVLTPIRTLGHRIVYVHLRNVKGHVPRFREAFLDEGNFDAVEVLRTLQDTGFDGFILDDHVPAMVGDEGFNYRGRAMATGYILGAVAALQHA